MAAFPDAFVSTTDPAACGVHVAADVPSNAVTVSRMAGGRSDGVVVIALRTGPLSLVVCPTRGLGLLSASYETADEPLRLGWDAPIGPHPVHPDRVALESRGGLGWLDGFNELLVRCGLSFNGPPGHDELGPPLETELTLHGRIANTPAEAVAISSEGDTLVCRAAVREATLFGANLHLATTLRLSPEGRIHIIDTVTNQSGREQEMQLLYHLNVDPRRLGDSLTLTPPAGEVEPRDAAAEAGLANWTAVTPPEPGYAEQVFLLSPTETPDGTVTTSLAGDRGSLTVRQSLETLPHLNVWKCFQDERDGYVLGLEPATGFPHFKAEERKAGRVVRLAPGEQRTHELLLTVTPASR